MGQVKLMLTLTDKQVVEMLRAHRWPNGVKCPYCGSHKIVKNGKAPNKPYVQRYLCRACGKQFNDLTGTPFAWTELPPSEVLTIAYLYFKLGMSQLAIARETGRSRTAVRRVIALFGKAIEAWFRSVEAQGRGGGGRGLRAPRRQGQKAG